MGLAQSIAKTGGDLVAYCAAEGRIFAASIGASSPTSFAKTAFDADQPQLVIDVPADTAIIPLYVDLALQDSAGTDTTLGILASTVNVGAGTSTAITPVGLRSDSGASLCSVFSLYTANGTDPATGTEIWLDHWVYAFADATTDPAKKYRSNLKDLGVILRDTSSLTAYVYATTTAPAGYLTAVWAEFPAGWLD